MDSVTATFAAAIATGLSALFIGWQAWETKQSAKSSKEAAQAANDSLELTRSSLRHSQLMTAEAIRSRLELHGPNVVMWFTSSDNDPEPFAYAMSRTYGKSLEKIRAGQVFSHPQDRNTWIYALFGVIFLNEGTSSVTVSSSSIVSANAEQQTFCPSPVTLEPKQRIELDLAVGTSFEQLIHTTTSPNRRFEMGGEGGWQTALEGDTGVMQSQKFKIVGTLLEPDDKEGNYILRKLGDDINYPSRLEIGKKERIHMVGGTILSAPGIDDLSAQ